jgi:hypothetical protein
VSTALFVIGAPGVGKTTAIRHLVPELRPFGPVRREVEKPKWTICGTTVLAGHYRGQTFDGGDTVPYTGAREALEYWKAHLLPVARLTIFDGDRFSTQPSLDFVRAAGVHVVGVRLFASPETTKARCAARGSNQNETWIKGRVTKANNFAAKIGAYSVSTDCLAVEVAMSIEAVLAFERQHEGVA